MKTSDLEIAVAHYFDYVRNIIVNRVSWGFNTTGYEADLFILTKSGSLYEVELKVSKSDMKADLKKRRAHTNKNISRMYYAFPSQLLDTALAILPQDAGLLSADVDSKGNVYVTEKRKAVTRRDVKVSEADQFKLARLGCIRYWKQRNIAYSKEPRQLDLRCLDSDCLLDRPFSESIK